MWDLIHGAYSAVFYCSSAWAWAAFSTVSTPSAIAMKWQLSVLPKRRRLTLIVHSQASLLNATPPKNHRLTNPTPHLRLISN